MDGCVFCAVVGEPSGSQVVWQDDLVVAFLDIAPITEGHCLVVPREHHVGLDDLPPEVAARMVHVAQGLGGALKRSGLRCDGVNLFLADGAAASQDVFHAHLHVIPRFAGDGFTVDADRRRPSAGELERAADAVRAGLSSA
ncbi:HIT family protein [Isoptericola sp. NPDC019693]|uniref:HIT family protein n=1 Tax=Isoptericola sp. NPDC019693 TaxID=3364009 RepID=UPI0037A334DF